MPRPRNRLLPGPFRPAILLPMTWWEKAVLLAFVAGVAIVFGGSTLILARALVRLVLRRPAPRLSHRVRWTHRILLALAGVGAACIAYGWLVEPYRLTQTRLRIECPKLPAGSSPLRVAFLSDLHCVSTRRLEDRIVEAIGDFKPDLILFGGDALSRGDGLDNLRRCLDQLARIAPAYAVRGNWDFHLPTDEFYREVNVTLLTREVVTLELGGTRVRLAGLSAMLTDQAAAISAGIPQDQPVIFLHHYPGAIYDAAGRADLYLCGHTHGGQIALPFYGALITLSRYGKRFESGPYHVNGTNMYVTRGIGMEGGGTPPIRFLAPPEVVLIELAPPTAQAAAANR